MKTFLMIAILIVSFLLNADALTTSGVISKEETWSGEVILTGDVTITGKLTVLPGTVIKCEPKSDDQKGGIDGSLIELIIDGGEIIASGTEEKRIVFTSTAAKPGKGDWHGIRQIRGTVTLQYCDESFGVTGFRAEISMPKKVENCNFKDNSDKGVSLSTLCSLTGCSFSGNSTGVHFEKNAFVRMERCEVKGNSGDGVSGQGMIRLEKCTIASNSGIGVNVSGGYGTTNTAIVSECTITSNGGAGMNVSGGQETTNTATVSGCTITLNNGAGVNMSSDYRATNTATVSGCTITLNGGTAVNVSSSSYTTNIAIVSGCTITSNGGAGVNVSGSGVIANTATVSGCTITSNNGTGVNVSGSGVTSGVTNTVTVSGCIITSNNGAGVNVSGIGDTTSAVGSKGFTENVISENVIGVETRVWGKLEGLTGNDIFGNIMYELKNTGSGEVIADDNYWGEPTTTELKNKVANLSMIYDKQDSPNVGPVTISTYRTEPMPPTPTLKTVSPDSGSVSGGTRVTITGSRFVAGATVTVGGKSATEVSVDSETQITATVPVGTVGPADVTITNPDGKSTSKKAGFVYVEEPITCSGIYQIDIALTVGVNSFSLPLRPETPITASKLAEDLGSTIVIRVQSGQFDAYVHDGKIGTDFPIEVGKGYIVNLRENRTYNLKGHPWGTEVPAAPTMPNNSTWAFVIAGRIDGTVPDNGRLRITNLRTGEEVVASISPSGEFTSAFVDMNQRPVIAEGDEIIIQLIGIGGVSLTEAKRYIISQKEIDNAYLLAGISTKIEKTTLLQNYPNPFNPETWIPFRLAENLDVKIRIYDLKGWLVRELTLGRLEAGIYEQRDKAAYWDGRNEQGEQAASGVYIYQMVTGKKTFTKRMVILK